MIIGILQVELFISDARSLKDKRRVVMSLKDRLGGGNALAVAEVDRLDAHQVAVLGIVTVSNAGDHVQSVLDKVLDTIRGNPRVVLTGHRREILTGLDH